MRHTLKPSKKKLSKNIILSGVHTAQKYISDFPEKIVNIYFGNSLEKNTRIESLKDSCNEINLHFENYENKSLAKIVNHHKHQGVVLEVRMPKIGFDENFLIFLKSLPDLSSILILDSIQDPGNLGAIIRSASAFSIDAIIINKNGSAPINDQVFKSSVGQILNIPIFYVINLNRIIKLIKKENFWVIGLDGNGENLISEEIFPERTALVLGSEGFGIKKLIKDNCDQLLRIPINPNTESLNVSVATGIILYELNKQHSD